jgi:peptidoglycan hydrolase-like protein with peptidoglycan-binding domain
MSRASIIETAKSQLNVIEVPAGSNKQKYGEWYGMNGVKWCAIFVSWVYDKAGHPLGKVETGKGYHYCQGAFNFWKTTGELTKNPRQGDIVLYDWKGDGHADHTGIFDTWKDDNKRSFFAWEGNTELGNDSNGGKVMRRERSIGLVKSFVSPKVLNDSLHEEFNETIKKGDVGGDVSYIQKLLWDLKYEVEVDGIFGSGTEKVVKQFQKDHFLEETGIVSLAVKGAMQEELTIQQQTEKKASTASYLQTGNSGPAVIALQHALNASGAKPVITADGVFGKQSFAALKRFQKNNGLTVDGVAGPKTFLALGIQV